MSRFRIERDAFGEVEVPADRYWGGQTQRALKLFDFGTETLPVRVVRVFGLQKMAALRANRRLNQLAPEIAEAIEVAARELADGYFDDHFPLPVWQTGSGTQTNMNANEVIANRANELFGQPLGSRSPVHPNDHVNCSQSSNDSFPTVMHVAAAIEVRQMLIPALGELRDILAAKAKAFDRVLKIGRTHLMDAVPMTMGQAFDAFARQVGAGLDRLAAVMPRLCLLPQGGSAVGSGLQRAARLRSPILPGNRRAHQHQFPPQPQQIRGHGRP